MVRVVAVLAWLLAAASLPQAAGAASRADLVAMINGLASLSALFEQQRFDETGKLIESSAGNCQVLRPGRFRWEYREPFAQQIVSDGTHVWIYDADLEQVTVNEIGTNPQGSPAALLGNETDVAAHYAIEELGEADDGLSWFALEPVAAATDYARIELGLADGGLGAMRLRDNLGQTTVITFSEVEHNGVLEAALFEFSLPVGVDVIRGSGAP